jgi:hypothetical protein
LSRTTTSREVLDAARTGTATDIPTIGATTNTRTTNLTRTTINGILAALAQRREDLAVERPADIQSREPIPRLGSPYCHVVLIEPKTTLNTGNVRNERTVEELERL